MDCGVSECSKELHTEKTKMEVRKAATSSAHIDSEIDVNRIKEEPGLVQFVKNELVLLAEDKVLENSGEDSLFQQLHGSEENKCKGYRCDKCVKVFKSKSIRHNHVNQVHSTESHKCTQCDREFNCKYYLFMHEQNKHSKVQYECDTCKKIYKSLKALRYHISSSYRRRLTDSSSKLHAGYSCNKCRKVFKSEVSLNRHIKQLHGTESYKCTWCNKEFKCKAYFLKHVAKYHHHRSADLNNHQSKSTLPIVSSVAACSADQSCGLTIKQELEDTDLDIGPTVFQHMDSHYRTKQVKVEQVKVENSPLADCEERT